MIIGVPKETKLGENRVALTPVGVAELTHRRHKVVVESGAGVGSGIEDEEFAEQGADVVDTGGEVLAGSDLVVKVKEPTVAEVESLTPDQILITYLHLATKPELTRRMTDLGLTAIAYETVEAADGTLPLLAPMSEIAGRLSVQAGAHHLERTQGGRGVLLGGVAGVESGRVVILGGGVAGSNAAAMAVGLHAQVTVLDVSPAKLRHLDEQFSGRVATVMSNKLQIETWIRQADLLIGAVLLPGRIAPKLVSEDQVVIMKEGSVIVDIAIDQGGCIATSRETTHEDPTYLAHDVVHCAVGNLPGAVPRTSTYALTNTTLPYIIAIADLGLAVAIECHPGLQAGVNINGGAIIHPGVAAAMDSEPVQQPAATNV